MLGKAEPNGARVTRRSMQLAKPLGKSSIASTFHTVEISRVATRRQSTIGVSVLKTPLPSKTHGAISSKIDTGRSSLAARRYSMANPTGTSMGPPQTPLSQQQQTPKLSVRTCTKSQVLSKTADHTAKARGDTSVSVGRQRTPAHQTTFSIPQKHTTSRKPAISKIDTGRRPRSSIAPDTTRTPSITPDKRVTSRRSVQVQPQVQVSRSVTGSQFARRDPLKETSKSRQTLASLPIKASDNQIESNEIFKKPAAVELSKGSKERSVGDARSICDAENIRPAVTRSRSVLFQTKARPQ